MEITAQNILPTQNIQTLLKNLSKGDQVAARVVRRLAPFRYVISFRGQSFKVNSAIHFNPDDFALIRLTETEPRLKFKFIGNLSAAGLQKPSAEILKLLGLGDGELAKIFALFSIKFNFPLKKTNLHRLMALRSSLQDIVSDREILAPFFWMEQFTARHRLPELPVFWDILFKSASGKPKKKPSRKTEVVEKGKAQAANTLSGSPLRELFSGGNGVKNVLSALLAEAETAAAHTRLAEGERDSESAKALLRYYLAVIQDFSENRWVGIPSKSLNFEKNFISFWRHCPKNPDQLDFCFQTSSDKMGSVAVSGNILKDKINLQLTFEYQELKELAENERSRLAAVLQKIGLATGKIDFEFSREVETIIGTMLFVSNESKIEVKI